MGYNRVIYFMKKFAIVSLIMVVAVLFSSCKEKIAVEKVELSKSTLELKVNETADLTATVLPQDAKDKTVTWSSSNQQIATVTNGKVKGIAVGNATITVTTKDGAKTATCAVKVVAGGVPGTDAKVSVTLGSETWDAKTASIYNYAEYNGLDCFIAKQAYTINWPNLPQNAVNFFYFRANNSGSTSISIMELLGGTSPFFFEYYENPAHYINLEGELFGDWWMLSGTVNITKFSGGKMSGTVNGVMLNFYEVWEEESEDPAQKLVNITFTDVSVQEAVAKSKAMFNSIHRTKAFLNKKLQVKK